MRLLHAGVPPRPHDLLTSWPSEPSYPVVVLLVLATAAALHARGTRRQRARLSAARGRALTWRRRCFLAGVAVIAAALLSPLDALSDALFAAHMTQHLLLVMVAAPLIALGAPIRSAVWALDSAERSRLASRWHRHRVLRRVIGMVTSLPCATLLHLFAIALWHLPALYELAERDWRAHALEHLSFFWSGLLFWYPVATLLVDRARTASLRARIAVMGSVAVVAAEGNLLGAALTLANAPWYTSHLASTGPWGLTPLEDQALAGAIMWIPAGIVYLAVLLLLARGLVMSRTVNRPWHPALASTHHGGEVASHA